MAEDCFQLCNSREATIHFAALIYLDSFFRSSASIPYSYQALPSFGHTKEDLIFTVFPLNILLSAQQFSRKCQSSNTKNTLPNFVLTINIICPASGKFMSHPPKKTYIVKQTFYYSHRTSFNSVRYIKIVLPY